MTFFERCRSFTVKVSGGSGVIFQPMTNDYSYILTAKHNLYNDPDTMKEAKEKILIEACGIEINFNQSHRYEHETLDIAILKINNVDIDTPFKEFEKLSKDLNYEFYGYPKYKRDENTEEIKEQIVNYKVSFSKQDASLITCDNSDFSDIEEIKGASGGGLFREEDAKIYLVAIEYEMNPKKDSIASHGRIDFMSIEVFDEIIEKNNELVPLNPPYMDNFDLLVDDIFSFTSLYIEKDKVINLLKDIVKYEIKDKITPQNIFEKYKNDLFVKNEDIKVFSNKELWVRYLEFLVLSKLIDNHEINLDSIDEVYKKRQFLFTREKSWIYAVKYLFSNNLKLKNTNTSICIASEFDTKPDMCEIPPKLVSSINQVPTRRMNIDRGISNPLEEISIQHIHNFQIKLTNNQTILDGLNIDDLEERVRSEAKYTFEKNS